MMKIENFQPAKKSKGFFSMKKKLSLILVLIVMSTAALAANYEQNYTTLSGYASPNIQIQQLRYEPYPVNPGEYFDLWVKAENLGSGLTPEAIFKLFPKYPFTLEPGYEAVQSIGKLTYDQPVVIKYRVKVDEDAVDGKNELKLGYNIFGDLSSWTYQDFDIQIAKSQTDFDLVIQEIADQTVSIAIANTGKNVAYSVIVKVPEQQYFDTIGTSGQMVGNLENGDYTMVSFDVKDKTRAPGKKQLLIQIDYTDTIGERRSVVKEVIYETGAMPFDSAMSEEDRAAMREQFAGRMGGMRPQQQKQIIQEWWFWAIVFIVLFVGWKLFKKFKQKKKKK